MNIINQLTSIQLVSIISTILIMIEILYHFRGKKASQLFLIIFSIGFIFSLSKISCALLITLSSLTYIFHINKVNITKYINFIIPISLASLILFKKVADISNIELIGVSYYLFRLSSFIIDDQRSKTKVPALDFFTWATFFPLLLAGPIQRFKNFKIENKELNRSITYSKIFIWILIKIFIIDHVFANMKMNLNQFTDQVFFIKVPVVGIFSFLTAFVDLFTYSLISNCVSSLLGYTFTINFTNPLMATNISKFWNSYHISLSSYVRDYVFFPGVIKFKNFQLATALSMMTMAFWHELSISWTIWGVGHSSLLIFYNYFSKTSTYKKVIVPFVKYPILNWFLRLGNIIQVGCIFYLVNELL